MSAKYQLETLPVREALTHDSECLLCDLESDSERRNVEFFLGSSVMAPEMRVQVNAHGFCPRHFHMLGVGAGKLGYALALATHSEELAGTLSELAGRVVAAGQRKSMAVRAVAELSGRIHSQESDCLMCDRIRRNLENYAYTIARLFQTDDEFRAAFEVSRGVCLHHLPLVLRLGLAVLKPGELPDWHRSVTQLMEQGLNRLAGELEEFTWQFDYTTDRETPETAQDSVARMVQKLTGFGPTRIW